MSRPTGTRKKYSERLTKKERKKIAARIVAGDKQVEVAREFGIRAETVREVGREFGISRWRELTPAIEKEILELLRKEVGIHRVVKTSRVPESKVRAIMREHGIVHESGGRALPPEKRVQIAEAVRRRQDYCVRLAEKFNVSRAAVQKIAHQVWGEGRFNGSAWPPMLAVFPQRNFDPQLAGPDAAVQLVSRICAVCFGGKLPPPENDTRFIAAMLSCLVPDDFAAPENIPQESRDTFRDKVRDNFAAGLTQAVDCIRRQHEARWEN